jgi:hypothetical protein
MRGLLPFRIIFFTSELKIIFRWISKEEDVSASIGFSWVAADCCEHCNELSWFKKIREISSPAEKLLTSQEILGSIETVTNLSSISYDFTRNRFVRQLLRTRSMRRDKNVLALDPLSWQSQFCACPRLFISRWKHCLPCVNTISLCEIYNCHDCVFNQPEHQTCSTNAGL